MAYFWLLIRSDAAAFSSSSLRAASSLSSSLPGGFELEFASDAAADAATARRAAESLPHGHIVVLGLRPAHAAIGAGAGDLRPVHCILLSHQETKSNCSSATKVIEFRGNQITAIS
uniref:Uncharacterized protein n=1 Tax=Arundo donax TaxID=35708 RepID=A0A0A9FFS8_ARUDO